MTTTDTKAIRDVRKYKLVHSNDYQSQMLVRPDGSWVKHDDYLALCNALDELRADNERLQTIIGNLHAVEGKHRETANAHFHRANRLQVENQRLRAALYDVIGCDHHNFCDGGPPKYVRIARAALAQKGGE